MVQAAGRPWLPGKEKMSASILFGAQVANGGALPTYQESTSGLVMRAGATRLLCGCGRDCGAICKRAIGGSCSGAADDCTSCCRGPSDYWCDGCGFKGPSLANLFERLAASSDYNEMVLDTEYWRNHLPQAVEAFVGTGPKARDAHRAFLSEYGLAEADVPLLQLDLSNWEAPFSLVS